MINLPTWYDTGTVSVASGGTTVTLVGGYWGDDAIMAGDLFCDPAQPLIPPQRVKEVTGDTTLELWAPWPGTAMTADPYEIRYVGIIERSTAQTRLVLEQLGEVSAYFDTQVDTLADRAAYDSRPTGYRVLVSDIGDGRAAIYSKKTSNDADWSDPAYLSGPQGIQGPIGPIGVNWRGAYDAGTTYAINEGVRFNNSSFRKLTNSAAGTAPSAASPPVDNVNWAVIAAKGADGTGTGDVVGPATATSGRYARFGDGTGKLLTDGPPGIPNADLATMVQAAIKGRAVGAGAGIPTDLTPAQVRAVAELAWKTIDRLDFAAGTTSYATLVVGSMSFIRIRGVLFPSAVAPLGLRLSQDGGVSWKQGASDYVRTGFAVIGANAPSNQSAAAAFYYLNTAENSLSGNPVEFDLTFENAVGGASNILRCFTAHVGSTSGNQILSQTQCLTGFGGASGGLQLTMPGATFQGRILVEGAA